MFKLRPYQSEIVQADRLAVHRGKKSILNVLPTGSGKTVIFAHIAASAAAKSKKVLVLVHRQEIFSQTLEKLFSFGVAAGQIRSGRSMTKNPIQVAMVGTAVNRLAALDKFDLIIIDEGHHAVAPSWEKILSNFPDTVKLFWTATPERADGRGMGDICDHLEIGWSMVRLISEGYLTLPMIKGPPPDLITNFHLTRGDFDKKEQVQLYTGKRVIGDVIEHHRKYLRYQPTISFVCSLQHASIMEGVYRDAGIKASMIQGGQKYMKERKSACKALADGSIEILISCDVISEGFDLPVVAGCHMLRKTMSLGLCWQQGGRVLRPVYAPGYSLATKPGRLQAIKNSIKPVAYILDFVGNFDLHGHILRNIEWNLESTKRDPRKNEPKITICPACNGRWPGSPRVCPDPDCGYQFANLAQKSRDPRIEYIAGQLVDKIPGLTQNDVEYLSRVMSIKSPKEKQKAMISQAFRAVAEDSRGKLEELARLAGYKSGWTEWAWKYAGGKVQR